MSDQKVRWHGHILGVVVGVLYGLFVRLIIAEKIISFYSDLFIVMNFAFVFIVPFVVGFLTIATGNYSPNRKILWAVIPWISAGLCLLAVILLAWEGSICVVLMSPLFMLMASLGGIAGGSVRSSKTNKVNTFVLASFAMLPFIVAPIENQIPLSEQMRVVHNQIEIHSDPQIIWNHIKRVDPIQKEEHSKSLTQWIGFPRPIEATLSHEGIGGVRHATFEGGVLFIETIDQWIPQQLLSFSIKADTSKIPPTTLDEHVTVGGPYFDVLQGTYRLEVVSPTKTILHLSSTHRLSTHFNFYSGLWTDFIMSDIQGYILEIVKKRCENPIQKT